MISVNNSDEALRDLFAESPGSEAADPLFVDRVMTRIARRRRMRTAAGAGLAAVLLAGAVLSTGSIADSTATVASLPVLLTAPVQELILSPLGFALSLPIGILMLTLSTLRVIDLKPRR